MARFRTTPIKNKFLAKIMQERGWETLQQMHEATGIALTTLSKYADNSPKQGMLLIAEEAKALGIDPGEWLRGNLGLSA